jgi:hypothetical protein
VKEDTMNHRTDDRVEELSLIPPEFKEFMQEIPKNRICNWAQNGQWYYPSSIDAQCGHCQNWVNLVKHGDPTFQQNLRSWIVPLRCVRCNNISKMFVDEVKQNEHDCKGIWVLPCPEQRKPKLEEDLVDPDIYDAYMTAIDCFNKGIWRSVVTESGRILEGITKAAFPKKKQRQMLGQITKNQNNGITKGETETVEEFERRKLEEETKLLLFKPLLQLGSAVRLGRLTGAHFKIKGITTQEVAEQVLDLVEYELIYFCKLIPDVEKLKAQVEEMSDEDEDE